MNTEKYTSTVAIPTVGPLTNRLEKYGIETKLIGMSILNRKDSLSEIVSFFRHFFTGVISFIKLIKNHKVDLVHTNTCHVLSGAIAAKILKIPHVWHIHERDISPSFLRKILSTVVLWLSDTVITVSGENRRQFFGKRQTSDKILVIGGGVEFQRFNKNLSGQKIRDEFNVGENKGLVGMIGRITPWKGQHYFVQAAEKALKSYPDTKFLVVGDIDVPSRERYKKDLVEISKRLNINNHLFFTGYRQDIPEILAALDILVLPSVEPEPFGLVLIEAMALSKPVIATGIGGPKEIVINQNTGLLVPPGDVEALSAAMVDLLGNKQICSEMGNRGRKRVEKRFTWNKTLEKIEKVYQRVLEN